MHSITRLFHWYYYTGDPECLGEPDTDYGVRGSGRGCLCYGLLTEYMMTGWGDGK